MQRHLNYHHLRYFWAVAREGGVGPAARLLNASQPTVSTQVKELEAALGERLLQRSGRRLALTDVGRMVFRYADEIMSLGRELLDAVEDRPTGRPVRLNVGIADAVPKRVAHRLLAPALALPGGVTVVAIEDNPERLLAELAAHALDLVLADAPAPAASRVRTFSHQLGESGVTFLAPAVLARRLRRGFPGSLTSAPLLLPTPLASLRRALDAWLATHGVVPRVVGEFDDTALLEVFGASEEVLFPVPSVVVDGVRAGRGLEVVGSAAGVRERYYGLTVERKITHPAVTAILTAPRLESLNRPGRRAARRAPA